MQEHKATNTIILFGEKESFSIQLGLQPNPEKCKLCFWVRGGKMGSFSKGGEVKYAIEAFWAFAANKEQYYLDVFEKMSPVQISRYLIDDLFTLGSSSSTEKVAEYQKRKRLHLFFGPQFSNDGSDIILLYRNDEVEFLYFPPKKVIPIRHCISYSNFSSVFENFIKYCVQSGLV